MGTSRPLPESFKVPMHSPSERRLSMNLWVGTRGSNVRGAFGAAIGPQELADLLSSAVSVGPGESPANFKYLRPE